MVKKDVFSKTRKKFRTENLEKVSKKPMATPWVLKHLGNSRETFIRSFTKLHEDLPTQVCFIF